MKKLLLLACLTMSVLAADATAGLVKTIDQLLAVVEKSDAKFIRNGDEHTGKDAADHMRRKYEHFKKKISTPEEFNEKCAAKSELSGKPYQIKTPDGKVVESKQWMLEKLSALRKEAN